MKRYAPHINIREKDRKDADLMNAVELLEHGMDREASDVCEAFIAEVQTGDYRDELKQMAIDTLNNELEYYRGAY